MCFDNKKNSPNKKICVYIILYRLLFYCIVYLFLSGFLLVCICGGITMIKTRTLSELRESRLQVD